MFCLQYTFVLKANTPDGPVPCFRKNNTLLEMAVWGHSCLKMSFLNGTPVHLKSGLKEKETLKERARALKLPIQMGRAEGGRD